MRETRIITRPDFDGIVCAALLKEALGCEIPVVWVQPGEMQAGNVRVTPQDIVANLPLPGSVALWFDHHVSNATPRPFKGLYRLAPSAAGLVQEYYRERLGNRFQELVHQADRIDAAQLTLDEILHPERYPHVLLSMTIFLREPSDALYCERLVALLREATIDRVLADPVVHRRCAEATATNRLYEAYLKRYTIVRGHISITDFRGRDAVPDGNRFLVYSLFPEAVVNIKLFNEGASTVIKLGHSILNRGCRVNVGRLLSRYGGGGHCGAGACRMTRDDADRHIDEIIAVLMRNESQKGEPWHTE